MSHGIRSCSDPAADRLREYDVVAARQQSVRRPSHASGPRNGHLGEQFPTAAVVSKITGTASYPQASSCSIGRTTLSPPPTTFGPGCVSSSLKGHLVLPVNIGSLCSYQARRHWSRAS
ncbi:hypothetical protein EI94DRAFT_564892 [Lactarius quietus]|nr:hypothetical protein EI94DRAFT_564892 [Lactarius quietus]